MFSVYPFFNPLSTHHPSDIEFDKKSTLNKNKMVKAYFDCYAPSAAPPPYKKHLPPLSALIMVAVVFFDHVLTSDTYLHT